jgi:hypothetical protein
MEEADCVVDLNWAVVIWSVEIILLTKKSAARVKSVEIILLTEKLALPEKGV